MIFTWHYDSEIGRILLAAEETGLIGRWLEGQKYFANCLHELTTEQKTPPISEAIRWLETYFSGREPDFLPPLHPIGSPFRQAVWKRLLQIPYGQTVSYGAIADGLAASSGRRVSAQAVGGAVGHNEISVIIPCHRVVGTNGSLTGYAGGLEKKVRLLTLEGVDMSGLFIPKNRRERQAEESPCHR